MGQKTTATLLSLFIMASPISVIAAEVCLPDKIIPHFETATVLPKAFNVGASLNKRLCRAAEGGGIGNIKFKLRQEGLV